VLFCGEQVCLRGRCGEKSLPQIAKFAAELFSKLEFSELDKIEIHPKKIYGDLQLSKG